ncbi:hypothetical protein BT69DRAFT_894412 [Atractiella rhizophila]|nr:hypothetical protein BT69DRAFT_894412 [Atractiella rhizophila]
MTMACSQEIKSNEHNLFHLYRISSDHKRNLSRQSIDSDVSSLGTTISISKPLTHSNSTSHPSEDINNLSYPPGLGPEDSPSFSTYSVSSPPKNPNYLLRRSSYPNMIQEEDLDLLSFPNSSSTKLDSTNPNANTIGTETTNGHNGSIGSGSPSMPIPTTRASPSSGLPIPTKQSSSPFAHTSSLPSHHPSDWPSSFPSSRPQPSRSNSTSASNPTWETPTSVQVSPARSRLPLPTSRSAFDGFGSTPMPSRPLYTDEREGRWERDGRREREGSLGSTSGRSNSMGGPGNAVGGIGLSNMSPFAGSKLALFGDLGNAAGARSQGL